MEFSYSRLDKIRQSNQLISVIALKDNLRLSRKVSEEKIISIWESYLLHASSPKISLYIHIPFCPGKKCSYCEYPSGVLKDSSELDIYLDRLEEQAKKFSSALGSRKLESLYIGGGTPSIFSLSQLERLYRIIFENFRFLDNSLLTHELSLATITPEKISLALSRGFRRFTFGVQSFDPSVLDLACRQEPDLAKIRQLSEKIQKTNGAWLSFDLMWGLAGDTLGKLEGSIRKALSISRSENISEIIIYSYHHSDTIRNRNKGNPAYFNYTRPYTEEDVRGLLARLSLEFSDFRFDSEDLSAVYIRPKSFVMPALIRYLSQPLSYLGNSALGLGIYSRSFIENHFSYICDDFCSYTLSYYPDKSFQKLIFILDSLFMPPRRIDTKAYKERFSTEFGKDFSSQLLFLEKEGKLALEGSSYIPQFSSEDDLVTIGLSFFPEKTIEELSRKTRKQPA